MRPLLLLPLLAVAASAPAAERLLYAPTARKIPAGTARYELRAETRIPGSVEHYLCIGLTSFWELELRRQNLRFVRPVDTADLTYNYLSPITGLTPGIAFGFQDVANQTEEGVRPFAVITFREGFFAIGGEYPADLTLGVTFIRGRATPLYAASLPFSEHVRFLSEHDGMRLSAGLEIRPLKNVGIRFLVRDKSSLLGLMIQRRF